MSYSYTMKGFTYPDFHVTLKLSGSDLPTDMNQLVGLAVSQDTSAANAVKLAESGDEVLGVIFQAENGVSQGEGISVTVALKGGYAVEYDGTAPSIGDKVMGAGNGKITTATEGVAAHGRVWEVDEANTLAVVYFE